MAVIEVFEIKDIKNSVRNYTIISNVYTKVSGRFCSEHLFLMRTRSIAYYFVFFGIFKSRRVLGRF